MTETEFCVPDHGSQAAIMAKLRALCEIRTFSGPLFELFRTFSRYVHLNCTKIVKDVKNGRILSKMVEHCQK